MKKPLEMAWMGPQAGWGRVLGNHQEGVSNVSQGDGDSDVTPVYACSGGGLSRGTMASASTSVWEKAAPPALTKKPDNSVNACVSLVPFELLPHHWSSEGVSVCKSMCGLLKRYAWDSRSPSPLSHNLHWFL